MQSRYDAEGYVPEFHYIQNLNITNSSIPQNVKLYDLPTGNQQSSR